MLDTRMHQLAEPGGQDVVEAHVLDGDLQLDVPVVRADRQVAADISDETGRP